MNIYLLDVSPFNDHAIFAKYYDSCPDYRKKKINSLQSMADRMLSLGAEVLLASGMRDRGATSYNIVTSPIGKPIEESNSVSFSISHSGKYVTVIFSNDAIGIDIETPRNINLKLADRFFSTAERNHINVSTNKNIEFLKIWTRKEALLKAAGTGITVSLSEICALDDNVIFQQKKYQIATIVTPDYILSVASHADISELIPENIIMPQIITS